ncbi:MAG: flavin reductase [Clostridia bacterium]|nr:flavin reductase [Clostridia bacterium]
MFKEISAKEIKENLINCIANEWTLISAGQQDGFNMMTASWGFAGELWGSDAVEVFVRPQRYTLNYLEKEEFFALSFYGENKDIHKVCGSMSGRDVNKTQLAHLTPVFAENTVYFNEARLVIICKKQYADNIKEECFIDKSPLKWYDNKDYHRFFIGKIEKVLINE